MKFLSYNFFLPKENFNGQLKKNKYIKFIYE